MTAATHAEHGKGDSSKRLAILILGAVGVVYGDIGTSPLYAFREALRPFAHDGVTPNEVIGLISLMVWTLTIIVTFKYVLFLLRADNDGEGGTLSLLALLMKKTSRHAAFFFFAGIIGAALFIGDAMITPALSVLSALEGLKLVTPVFTPYVIPTAVGIMFCRVNEKSARSFDKGGVSLWPSCRLQVPIDETHAIAPTDTRAFENLRQPFEIAEAR